MRLLAIDIGAGSEDILLLDTSANVENSIKMIMPSPTQVVARKIGEATKKGHGIFFWGTNMGGGPCRHALIKHTQQGYQAFSTPEAARTFDDDLEEVQKMGVEIVSLDEAKIFKSIVPIELKDIDLAAIRKALEVFGASAHFNAVAVAVQDHGKAPKGESDRIFRFQHLKKTMEKKNELVSFAYLRQEIPEYLTRMKAIAESLEDDLPLLLMDTGPAAALGSFLDEEVAKHRDLVIANLGNFHTLAFHLHGNKVLGLFEHHTELLTGARVDKLIKKLAAGAIKEGEVFADGGHGSFILQGDELSFFLAICGPQRKMMKKSSLTPYFVAPFGDMMLTGCFGLVSAFAQRVDSWREEIHRALWEKERKLEKFHQKQ